MKRRIFASYQRWGGLARAALLGGVVAGLVSGCSIYTFPAGTAHYPPEQPVPGGRLIGLALSGGGNRSAVYSSYVLELLASLPVSASSGTQGEPLVSFLDRVGYISSVSGGSFAAAYFGLVPHDLFSRFTPLLLGTVETTRFDGLPDPYGAYFAGYHAAMNYNWEVALFFGLHLSPLHVSNASRLAGEIDNVFLKNKTVSNLAARESGRDGNPYLVFNATNYDNGRRFVMTTLPRHEFCVDVENLLRDVSLGLPTFEQRYVQCKQDVLTPDGFDALRLRDSNGTISVDSSNLRVSTIVATSGAFPLVVGPLTYKVSGYSSYLHLIDGGLTDNAGVESLAQLFLGKLMMRPSLYNRGLIVEIDASLPFDVTGANIADVTSPVGGLISDVSRPSDIQEVRASLYRHDLWELASEFAKNKSGNDSKSAVAKLTIRKLQHTEFLYDPAQNGISRSASVRSLVPLPRHLKVVACHAEWNAETAHRKVVEIPTRYALDDCQVALLRLAACWSVYLHAREIQKDVNFGTSATAPQGLPMLDTRIRWMCPELDKSGALSMTMP